MRERMKVNQTIHCLISRRLILTDVSLCFETLKSNRKKKYVVLDDIFPKKIHIKVINQLLKLTLLVSFSLHHSSKMTYL